MKKILTTTLALALTVSLTACGQSEEDKAKAAAVEMTCATLKPIIDQDFEALQNIETKLNEIVEKYDFENVEDLVAAGENISDEEMYEAVEKECDLTKEQIEAYESGMGMTPEITPPAVDEMPPVELPEDFEMPDELTGLEGDDTAEEADPAAE
jgi:hypothetical protein